MRFPTILIAEAVLSLQGWRLATCDGVLDSGSLAMASPEAGLPVHDPVRTFSRPPPHTPGLRSVT
jgi:hypothetical protein